MKFDKYSKIYAGDQLVARAYSQGQQIYTNASGVGKVGQFYPEFAADFANNAYSKDFTPADFSDNFTYTGASLKTMVDSDGVLKWAPHNLLTYSEDFSNAVWSKINISVSSSGDGYFKLEASSGTDIPVYVFTSLSTSGFLYTSSIDLKKSTGSSLHLLISHVAAAAIRCTTSISLDDGSIRGYGLDGNTASRLATVEDMGEYFRITFAVEFSTYTPVRFDLGIWDSSSSPAEKTEDNTWSPTGTEFVEVRHPHLYRSDLGGMVANPFRGDSYVPTTSSAKYLPRLGHHVWDGSQWVNEGLLVESESRTNLALDSQDLSTANWFSDSSPDTTITAGSGDGYTTVEFSAASTDRRFPVKNNTATISISLGEVYCAQARFRLGSGCTTIALGFGTSTVRWSWAAYDTVAGTWSIYTVSDPGVAEGLSAVEIESGVWELKIRFTGGNSGADFVIAHFGGGNAKELRTDSPVASCEIGFVQVEAASTPSSYIPTSGSTATRAAETQSSDELTYDSSAMWFTLEGLETYADLATAGQVELFDWRADANNRITVTLDTDSTETGEITLTVVSGGTSWSVAADYLTPGINQPFSIAWRVTSSEINLAVGGTAQTAVSTTSIPDLSAATASWEGMGARTLFRQGTGDVGDSGIAEASA